jgi:short-subunit dehydrogenase
MPARDGLNGPAGHGYLLEVSIVRIATGVDNRLHFVVQEKLDYAAVMAKARALITGASSGIGEALAAQFAADGFDLVLVARSEDKLKDLAGKLVSGYGVKAHVEPADLSQPDAASTLAGNLKRAKLPLTALVNNAGILEHGRFVDIPAAQHQQQIDLNIAGLTAMLSAFVPDMVSRGEGRVLNVASIAAFQPIASLATYAATKAYVLSLTESLSEELKGTGVTATALCPGVTATNMLSGAQIKNEQLTIPDFVVGDVADVAREGYRACMKGEVICVPGLINQVSTLASRNTPKWLLRRVTGIVGRYTMRR